MNRIHMNKSFEIGMIYLCKNLQVKTENTNSNKKEMKYISSVFFLIHLFLILVTRNTVRINSFLFTSIF